MQNKELKFIEIIKNSLQDASYLGDDCAYLPEFGLCATIDTLVEDVHFSLSTANAALIAKKALKANISDILASGSKPEYVLVSLSGKLEEKFVADFYEALNAASIEFGVKIAGGDLTSGEKISISICALGSTKYRNISSRKNARAGYILALCGEFGTSAHGLGELVGADYKKTRGDFEALSNNFMAEKNAPEADFEKSYFAMRHLDPILYPFEAKTIATSAIESYAMMDSSDGLINALEWISKSSNVGFSLEYAKIPKANGVSRSEVLFGGEDFSLVICVSQADFEKIKHLKNIVPVGFATENQEIIIDGENIKNEKREEFLHFD